MLRALGLIAGTVCVLLGALWMLQGLGLVMWPADSFMLANREWAYNGAVAMGVGLVFIWLTWRKR
ncbi:hypothetical protein D6851_02085 [Altericroceibacterium spongiae]|uniref:Uncharacterized protein n=1 Tax=Altericroceibacterium spongiae TaxID=2320269 RepID=A0A420ERH0_9SPHN|nr:hypothetical protein [Altericroceibacterium spongiae]RKF23288.1 hypothetical protein D6851_02085 [Altericroceibacterium spongiae]